MLASLSEHQQWADRDHGRSTQHVVSSSGRPQPPPRVHPYLYGAP